MPYTLNPIAGTLDYYQPGNTSVVVNTSNIKSNVEPDESPDGSRTTFTVPEQYIQGTLLVSLNGQVLTDGSDYNETTSTTFTFTSAPLTGDVVRVLYGVPTSTSSITTTTSDLTLDASNYTVRLDGSSNTVTVTLPDATIVDGRQYVLIGWDDTNTLTVNTTSSQTIRRRKSDTNTSDILLAGDILKVQSDGTGWQVIS